MPDNLCIISLPISYNQNMTVHCQPRGLGSCRDVGTESSTALPPSMACVLYSCHCLFTVQNGQRWLSARLISGERKERDKSTISTLTYLKQSHLITKLKVIMPHKRAIMVFSFFFSNVWMTMSWQAIRLQHLNSTWRIYSPFLSSRFL